MLISATLWRDWFGYWFFNSIKFPSSVVPTGAEINLSNHMALSTRAAAADKQNTYANHLPCAKQSAVMARLSKSNASGMRRISVISIGFRFPKSMNCIVAKPSWTTSTHSTRYHRPFVYFTTQCSLFLRSYHFLLVKIQFASSFWIFGWYTIIYLQWRV